MMRKIKKCVFYLSLTSFSVAYIMTTHYFIERYQDEHDLPVLWHSTLDFFYPDDTSCYPKKGDYLMSIEKKAVIPDSIFFFETSCQRNLGVREACSIEATARSHPNKFVYILFTRPLTEKESFRGPLGEANRLLNVHFYRVNVSTYADHTPLQDIFNSSLTYGKRHHRRVAEYLKFVTLYRYGGMVVDLDMMVVADTERLGNNWMAKESAGRMGSAIVALARDRIGRKVTPLVLSALKDQHESRVAEIDSGKALYEVLKHICSTTSIAQMNELTCDGLKIYEKKLFYPVRRSEWNEYFAPNGKHWKNSLGHYLWSSQSRRVPVSKTSLYAKLAKKYCPNVYKKFARAFDD